MDDDAASGGDEAAVGADVEAAVHRIRRCPRGADRCWLVPSMPGESPAVARAPADQVLFGPALS